MIIYCLYVDYNITPIMRYEMLNIVLNIYLIILNDIPII